MTHPPLDSSDPILAGPPPGLDPVSGALNISSFGQQYAQLVMGAPCDRMAIWFVDIHNFRSINPKYGYVIGNRVLQIVSRSLRENLSRDLPVARLGGDRFVMLTAKLDHDEVKRLFEVAMAQIEREVIQIGVRQSVALSAGVYYLGERDYKIPSFQQALDYASVAHRNAREDRKANLVFFTEEDLRRDMRRIAIEQSLREALLNGQIEVWFQPQVDYTLGVIVGAEALARWHHPDLGWISPKEFIPILENCGKVHDLDLFVWEEACRCAGKWRSVSDGNPVPISVNVSRTEMYEPGLLEHFLELQKKYDLPVGSLRLEVTEGAFSEDAGRIYDVIERMRAHKLLVEMDDFGSGLSSLTMLKDVPVDVVKLDMGFLQSAMSEDRGGVVLGSVIRMLQGLDTPIIAEGVETLEQAEMLKNMGCHLMQGYHFSRPMPLEDFEDFVATTRAVERTVRRERTDAHLDELMSFDGTSSYLFNHAIGGTIFFFMDGKSVESILANDAFYEACGLVRGTFGNAKVNPIDEVDEQSRATMWRATAEAREYGTAMCRAKVRLTGRWIECVMRYLGESSRGSVYSLNVVRSGDGTGSDGQLVQSAQDLSWDLDMLNSTVPNSFVKADVSDALTMNYVGPRTYELCGLTQDEFVSRFRNSLIELVHTEDRQDLKDAVRQSKRTGKGFSCGVRMSYGYSDEFREVVVTGRVSVDDRGQQWLYALVLFTGDPTTDGDGPNEGETAHRITFVYTLDDDRLVLHLPHNGDGPVERVYDRWLQDADLGRHMSVASMAKIMAAVRDLRSHPVAGFMDIKCRIREDEGLRWYHINYTCESNEAGETTAIHGYAMDANDQMGSARWWRKQAETDQLTGLLNRNAAEQEINMSVRGQGAGMMFMVDLDGFKSVNDNLGHLAGDALLRDVAQALRGCFREGDVLGRYGGDEFVAFMPLMTGDAYDIADRRARSIIEAIHKITATDGTHAACSVGVAITHSGEATFYDLLETADEAMYQSKERGKGCHTILEM